MIRLEEVDYEVPRPERCPNPEVHEDEALSPRRWRGPRIVSKEKVSPS